MNFTKKTLVTLLTLIAVLMSAVFLLSKPTKHRKQSFELSYQEMSAGELLNRIIQPVKERKGAFTTPNKEIAIALRNMGTNSLPVLIAKLKGTERVGAEWVDDTNKRQKFTGYLKFCQSQTQEEAINIFV
ncbi:MAG: hypothetical protein WCO56_18050 [Verrucomicrobiota bacterium]